VIAASVEPPAAWESVAFDRPDLSESPGVTLVDWRAWGPAAPLGDTPNGAGARGDRLVTGCFTRATSRWTPEAEPIALDKLAQVATSTALRVADVGPLHVTTTDRRENVVSQRLEGAWDAKTFLAFEGDTLIGCFVSCVESPRSARTAGCAASVDAAHLEGAFGAPPPRGVWLTAAMAATHHPRLASAALAALAASAAMLAVATRKRPRVR
jgi:hypothetical protein